MATILPVDWQGMLGRVCAWLERTSAEAERREEAFRVRCERSMSPEPELPSAALKNRLRDLPAKLQPLEQAAAEADQVAEACETSLRELVQRSERLRRSLAEEVGRAIG